MDPEQGYIGSPQTISVNICKLEIKLMLNKIWFVPLLNQYTLQPGRMGSNLKCPGSMEFYAGAQQ